MNITVNLQQLWNTSIQIILININRVFYLANELKTILRVN